MWFAPVQVELLNSPGPTELAAAVKTVSNEDIVVSQLSGLPEGDAGDLGGDVAHRPQHDLLVRRREGVVELELDHPARPQPVGVGQVGVQASLVSSGAVANNDVSFDGGQLPLVASLQKRVFTIGLYNF